MTEQRDFILGLQVVRNPAGYTFYIYVVNRRGFARLAEISWRKGSVLPLPPGIRSLKGKVSAVGKECFAEVRTSDSGSESRWFDSSHRFAGVVQNPFRLSPHLDIASAVEKEFFGLINPVSPVQVRPVTNLALVYEGGVEASQ